MGLDFAVKSRPATDGEYRKALQLFKVIEDHLRVPYDFRVHMMTLTGQRNCMAHKKLSGSLPPIRY
jgi:hypothetical protein